MKKEVLFKTYTRRLGHHYITNVFSAKGQHETFAKLGELAMNEEDYKLFLVKFQAEHKRTDI